MSDLSPEEYQKQYEAALEAIDAGAAPAIPPKEEKTEPVTEESKAEAPKVDEAVAEPVVDEAAKLREELDRALKQVADNKAWATKEAQRRAEIEREWNKSQREASRPAILDTNPELVEAIKFVTSDPAPQQEAESTHQKWLQTIEAVHPGIFAPDADPELVDALVAKRDASGDAWNDPLVAIRDIAAEKVAHAERQVGKRFAIEAAKQAAKSAMSVPAAGGGAARTAPNPEADAVSRIQSMTDAEFAAEVRKVKGY